MDLASGGGSSRKDPLDHPLFKGVGPGTMQRFRDELKRVTIRGGQRLTRHGVEDGASSPRNALYLAGEELLTVRLHALGKNPERKPGLSLGDPVTLRESNIGSWFGGSTHVPTSPGLAVSAQGKQRAHMLPSLARFFDPDRPDQGILQEDVERLLINTAGIFSGLLHDDNRTETTAEEGYRPHRLPTVEMDTVVKVFGETGVHHHDLQMQVPFSPASLGLDGPHILLLSGSGFFFDANEVAANRASSPHPLAELGDVEGEKTGESFAFQWAALNPGMKPPAIFVPSGETTASVVPVRGNLDLLHLAVRSIAESAASMHEHVSEEEVRLGGVPARVKHLLKRVGLLS
jgi:hypothetical protein